MFANNFTTSVLSHKDICQPTHELYSFQAGIKRNKCPRAVVEVLGNLLIGKMAFNALAGPTIVLVSYSHPFRRMARYVSLRLERNLEYTSLDKDTASVIMALDIALVCRSPRPPNGSNTYFDEPF